MRVFTSPVRETMTFQDDEIVRSMYLACTPSHATRSRLPETPQLTSPTESDAPLSPWASPDCTESEYAKRGRPRANMIKTLIDKGTFTESAIRCKTCNRVFPRDKSLQAHMRTHTGESWKCALHKSRDGWSVMGALCVCKSGNANIKGFKGRDRILCVDQRSY